MTAVDAGQVGIFMMLQKQRSWSSRYQSDAGHEAQAAAGAWYPALIENRTGR
jgi:hypothetical protein